MAHTWHSTVFFGLHFDIHANEKDTTIGEGLTVDHLVKELSKVKPDYIQCDCKGHRGYTSWPTATGTPSPGIVQDPLKIWCEAARQLGIPIIMHYSGVWDYAAILKHPEYGRVNPPAPPGSWTPKETNSLGRDANMTCPLSNYTRDLMIPQMFELIDQYGVNGFWVDGDNWASEPCYCDTCTGTYRKLAGKPDLHIPVSPGEEGWEEWLHYSRGNFERHVREYTEAVHAHKPGVTVISNWMYTIRQPDPITVPVDYISGDFSWIWSVGDAETEARFMSNRGIEWELMAWGFTSYGKTDAWTFKSLPALCQEAGVVLSCGGTFLVYDTPERSCRIIPWHMDILGETAEFCRARKPYWGGESVPQAAILHASRPYYRRNVPLFNIGSGAEPVEGALAVLLGNGYDADILSEADYARRMAQFPLCIVPAGTNGTEGTGILSAHFRNYVEEGGTLVLSELAETQAFDELLGVKDLGETWESTDSGLQINLLCDQAGRDSCVPAYGKWRLVQAEACVVVSPLFRGRDPERREEQYPGIVYRKLGKGAVIGFFGPFLRSYAISRYPRYRKLFAQALSAVAAELRLAKLEAPPQIHIAVRHKENRLLVHLTNIGSSTPNTPKSAYIEDVNRVYNLNFTMPLSREPVRVYLAPGHEPQEWNYRDGVLHVRIESVYIYEILVIEI
ncbi:MAG: alpha-L-fucosidase [Treponema sp.]|jgi:hypothetical protein|nr:alpha-L-fucosidase [Treponema sp.]